MYREKSVVSPYVPSERTDMATLKVDICNCFVKKKSLKAETEIHSQLGCYSPPSAL